MSSTPSSTPPKDTGNRISSDELFVISQQELHDDTAQILQKAMQGTEFIITERGRAVAHLAKLEPLRTSSTPTDASPSQRPASDVKSLVRLPVSTQEILDELREERF